MMRKFLFLILFVSLFVACVKDKKDAIVCSPERMAFNFVGGAGKIQVTSQVKWNATSDASWIKIDSLTPSALFFQAEGHRGNTPRFAFITISYQDENHQVLIEQTPPSSQPERAFDSLALVDLAKQCDGQNWYFDKDTVPRPWVFGKPINLWDGVITSEIDGQLRVIGLVLSGCELKGELPERLVDLTELQIFMMRQNEISGDVISLCAKFEKLIYLDLARNEKINFKDTPPAGSFSELKYLDLSVCPIYGPIPSWALRPGLVEFSISSSNITGEIPIEIGEMKNLTKLDLSDNKFTGKIPLWLTSLTELNYLDLATCQLSGQIPQSIGRLSSLKILKLGQNKLDGDVPSEISMIENLNILNLSNNKLVSFPDQIIKECRKLNYVDISFNNIEGKLIKEWALLPDLETFIVLGNRMTGDIPLELTSDHRWVKVWHAKSLIYPQQAGYGFSNVE